MPKLEDIQKELQQMGDHFQRLQNSVAQLAKEQAESKEAQAGETTEFLFASAERKGAAYPLEGHAIRKADPKTKEAYLSLLLFTWSLLQPEAKEADAGLVTVARIRESLHVDTTLYSLFCHMKETSSTDLENWFQQVDRFGGKSAYLLDILILCQEMKAESDSSYWKLSQLYLLMGCKEPMLEEAIEATGLIHERNRYEYIQCENHKWKSFDGKAGECYLSLVGDLNTSGRGALTSSYYALWPERAESADGVSKYAPKVMLKIEVAEGAIVEKGQTLFTVYGAKESVARGRLQHFGLGNISIYYDGSSDWGYIFTWNRMIAGVWEYEQAMYEQAIESEQKWVNECFLDSYESCRVKADRDGIVHWQPWVNQLPFWCIKEIAGATSSNFWKGSLAENFYYGWRTEMKNEGRDSIDLQLGDIFVSSGSMTPTTIGKTPICVVDKI